MDEAGELTSAGRSARDEIEQRTDDGQSKVIRALGNDLDQVIQACHTIGESILAAHAAPADPRKRAAG